MDIAIGIGALAQGAIVSPFPRLRRLLQGTPPGHQQPIDLSLGEPREAMPTFVADKLKEAEALYARYPHITGSDELRCAIAAWIGRRYGLGDAMDAGTEILPLNGSREGLFYAIFPAVGRKSGQGPRGDQRPAVLIPNPFYQTYAGAALAADCDPVYLPATRQTGFLPDLDALAANEDLLARTAAFYLCSPANPQGAVAGADYIARALELARAFDFMLFTDECYSEIYSGDAPTGAFEVAAKTPERWRNLIVFNSLSKRSNLPGLRSGFCAGDADFLEMLIEVRSLIGPQVPLPTQHASAAIWSQESHVSANRKAYSAKFDIADKVLAGRYGYQRPGGGFFLWLEMGHMGGGIDAAVTLWQRCGVKVIPGAFLAQDGDDGRNPGQIYVRVALIHDAATIQEALERIVSVCG